LSDIKIQRIPQLNSWRKKRLLKKCKSVSLYCIYRNKMLSSLAILNMNGVEINVDTLLFGNDFLSDETNCEILVCNTLRYLLPHEKCADFFTFWKYIWRIYDLKWAKIGICRISRSNVFHSLIVEGKKDCWRSASLFTCWLIYMRTKASLTYPFILRCIHEMLNAMTVCFLESYWLCQCQ
jgi:hypothetical protein